MPKSWRAIIPAIAEALGLSFSGPADLRQQLIKYMFARIKHSALLVLDKLEHLIVQSSETVELIAEMLQRLPHLKILTNSRERLNLQGEWDYELHGLPVPPPEFLDKMDDYSAAVLFVQSARPIKTDFEIGESERVPVPAGNAPCEGGPDRAWQVIREAEPCLTHAQSAQLHATSATQTLELLVSQLISN